MKALVTASDLLINGRPVAAGETVDLDDQSYTNLIKKGRIQPVGTESTAATPEMDEEQIEAKEKPNKKPRKK
jgi:hypothetical protein